LDLAQLLAAGSARFFVSHNTRNSGKFRTSAG